MGLELDINPDNGHGAADGFGSHGEYCDCGNCIARDNWGAPDPLPAVPTAICRECQQPMGEHYNLCQFDNPPGLMTLEWLLDQEVDFHTTRAARGIACPVCGKHARYCGHTREDMIQKLSGGYPPGLSRRWPVLASIGLFHALDYVERVAASNTDKHGTKWLTKTISWHDAKAVKHLGAAQADTPKDPETGLSSRAHAALRLLMALGLELRK